MAFVFSRYSLKQLNYHTKPTKQSQRFLLINFLKHQKSIANMGDAFLINVILILGQSFQHQSMVLILQVHRPFHLHFDSFQE